jgi:argininosuccinate lyase
MSKRLLFFTAKLYEFFLISRTADRRTVIFNARVRAAGNLAWRTQVYFILTLFLRNDHATPCSSGMYLDSVINGLTPLVLSLALQIHITMAEAAGTDNATQGKSTKLWGGRFSRDSDVRIRKWTESVTIDTHLAREDMWGSIAHATMLGHQGIIPASAAGQIAYNLDKLLTEFETGKWQLGHEQEDVHMNVEKTLITRTSMDVGGRMHTCRSRNDQVVLDSKLYCRNRLLELRRHVLNAADALIKRAEPHTEDVMVGYTHFQHAQPVSIAFWLSHYAAVLYRDADRLKAAYDVADENPLGSGAISGTSFPIDRTLTTKMLGFQKIHVHAMDATSSRDFMWEALCAAAMVANTLSRLAEELILYSSYEYRTIVLDDGFAMGSSMMPQKKNPGTLELVRGRAARLTGYATAGFVLTKGLPPAYNRDFHEDKELLVASLSIANNMVEIIPALVETMDIKKERMAELTYGNFCTATELANYLVLKHNVPFREAHHVVGSLVGELTRAGKNFSDFDYCLQHLRKNKIDAPEDDIRRCLDPKAVMLSYNCIGGTGKQAVEDYLKSAKELSAKHRAVLDADQARVDNAREASRALAREAADVKTAEELVALVAKHFA